MPQYTDLLEDEGDISEAAESQLGLIKSCKGWWKEMAKWVEEERAQSDDDGDEVADTAYSHQCSKWLLQSLDLLFGSWKETDIDVQVRQSHRQQAYTEEARLMELLMDEEADEDRIPHCGPSMVAVSAIQVLKCEFSNLNG